MHRLLLFALLCSSLAMPAQTALNRPGKDVALFIYVSEFAEGSE